MTVALCRVGFVTLRDSFIQPSQSSKLAKPNNLRISFKTLRSRTWDLNQALDTVQRKKRDHNSNQGILFHKAYILHFAGYFKPAIRLRHNAV